MEQSSAKLLQEQLAARFVAVAVIALLLLRCRMCRDGDSLVCRKEVLDMDFGGAA
jgi:hypothetical protein